METHGQPWQWIRSPVTKYTGTCGSKSIACSMVAGRPLIHVIGSKSIIGVMGAVKLP